MQSCSTPGCHAEVRPAMPTDVAYCADCRDRLLEECPVCGLRVEDHGDAEKRACSDLLEQGAVA